MKWTRTNSRTFFGTALLLALLTLSAAAAPIAAAEPSVPASSAWERLRDTLGQLIAWATPAPKPSDEQHGSDPSGSNSQVPQSSSAPNEGEGGPTIDPVG